VTLAWQLGAKGYISMLADLAPKAELHLLSLLDKKHYEKFEQETKKLHA